MTPLESIDAELTKLARALHDAIMAEDHARQTALIDDADDLLDRRLFIRPARTDEEPTRHGPTR
jgi:hypothetical protein